MRRRRPCPFCGAKARLDASQCRRCGQPLPTEASPPPYPAAGPWRTLFGAGGHLRWVPRALLLVGIGLAGTVVFALYGLITLSKGTPAIVSVVVMVLFVHFLVWLMRKSPPR